METKKYLPLSHSQKRIWYNENIFANTSLYNIGGLVRVKGTVDFDLLEQAIHLFIKVNEGLRLQITAQDGEPMQYVQPYLEAPLRRLDFSGSEDPFAEAQAWAEQEFRHPFRLEQGRLFDFALLKINDHENAYFVKFHHIVSDGWTILIMTDQISEFYEGLRRGETVADDVSFTYIDYLSSEQNYLNSARFQKNKTFWNEKLSELPNAFLLKSSDTIEGKRRRYYLEDQQAARVQAFVEKETISFNTLFTALMALYLHKVHQYTDLILGVPVLNRSGFAEKRMVGMFTSTMPLRITIDPDESVAAFFSRVTNEFKQCFLHQKYPYNLLVNDLELTQNGYDNLFQYCVNYYNTKLNTEMDGAPLENIEFYSGYQTYALQLVIKEWMAGKLELQFDYNTADFTDSQVEEMFRHLLTLLAQVIEEKERPIQSLQLLTAAERDRLLYACNQTDAPYPQEQTIQALFAEQVQQHPNRVAVEFSERSLTYSELNERANQLARVLVDRGVTKGQLVGIMATHSIEVVVAILAVLKSGAAYLPIDPEYPQERIRYILQDSRTAVLLTNLDVSSDLGFAGEVIGLNEESLFTGDASDLPLVNEPSDPVYVIYTSGSTGNPKGACILQQGLVNYVWWAKKRYVTAEDDVFALYSSIAFDLTVTSIFTPLISGVKVVIYQENGTEFILHTILRDNKATVVKLTPAHLGLLKDRDNLSSGIRRFIVGGEDLKTGLAAEVVHSFGDHVEILNEYGPTETIVGCMIHRYDPATDVRASVPIGTPIDNVQIYLLDDRMNPVPDGMIGQIYISGDGVAAGYLHRPELTSERFLPNPFLENQRMYMSGDLGVRLANGQIEYLGRIDSQVKIKGYRIETGEIESRLLQHDAITDAVVIARDEGKGNYLVAYVVPNRPIYSLELRQFLVGELPSYMVPPFVVTLPELPLSPNGKVDRKALPHPAEDETDSLAHLVVNGDVEQELLRIVQEVLKVDAIEPTANFYELGGDSVKAIQIVARLGQGGLKLRVKDILNYPVLRELAATIQVDTAVTAPQQAAEGAVTPTPIMRWFFSQAFTNPGHWNQSVLLELKRDIPLAVLQDLLNSLVRQHDMLRLQVNVAEGRLAYNPRLLDADVPLSVYDFSAEPSPRTCLEQTGEALKAGLDLTEGPLFQAALFRLGASDWRLLLTAHHLVVDAVSWRILLEDVERYLHAALSGQTPKLPLKTHSFQQWAERLVAYVEEAVPTELMYWQERMVAEEDIRPVQTEREPHGTAGAGTLEIAFSTEVTERLLTEANRPYHTQALELLLAALTASVTDWSGHSRVPLELEGHGREALFDDVDISRTVGWFTTMFPLALQHSRDVSALIKTVKEEVRQVPGKGIGYGLLAYVLEKIPTTNQPFIRFNYLGEVDNAIDNEFFSIAQEASGSEQAANNHLTTPLELVAMVAERTLRVKATFDAGRLSRDSVARLLDLLRQQVVRIVDHCCQKTDVDFTSADFDTVELSQADLDFLFD